MYINKIAKTRFFYVHVSCLRTTYDKESIIKFWQEKKLKKPNCNINDGDNEFEDDAAIMLAHDSLEVNEEILNRIRIKNN